MKSFQSPQLPLLHQGKVRDSFFYQEGQRLIVVSDRISAFDSVLHAEIKHKGALLNTLSAWWFEKTKDIIPNHLLEVFSPSCSLVQECQPLKVEVIVRGFLTGSMWRDYAQGKRVFSGQHVPDSLKQNEKFSKPLLTPTTKSEHDEEISPQEIIQQNLVSASLWTEIEKVALKLYERGCSIAEQKGLYLVDTKYEFGIYNNKLMLIDEIHTPDSSRYWSIEDYQRNPLKVDSFDKEYIRSWLKSQNLDGKPAVLPLEVIEETVKRYQNLFERLTHEPFKFQNINESQMVLEKLIQNKKIKDGFVALICGSEADIPFATKIAESLKEYQVHVALRICSAHKNGEDLISVVKEMNHSIEPGCIIAIAGLSNGLGGALSANVDIPVINCPPFNSEIDMHLNLYSSLMYPSGTPAVTVIKPHNAVLAALKSLNTPRLRQKMREEIQNTKQKLNEANEKVKEIKFN